MIKNGFDVKLGSDGKKFEVCATHNNADLIEALYLKIQEWIK